MSPAHSYADGGARTVTLTVTDTAGQSASTTGQVAPFDPTSVPCTGCMEYSGTLAAGGTAYPAGSAGFTASGSLEGWLRGPAAADHRSTTGSTVLSGTSMASPHVAGVLALVRSNAAP